MLTAVARDVRADFPGLADGWTRLDGAAGTQVLGRAADAVHAYLTDGSFANDHGVFPASVASERIVEDCRAAVARMLRADPEGLAFGPSSTALVTRFVGALAQEWRPGDHVVCTALDHDANVLPWLAAAERAGAEVTILPVRGQRCDIDVDDVARAIRPTTRWLAITGASNALGTMPDVGSAIAVAHAAGVRVLVDAVHLTPHRLPDVGALGCDALMTSPYKWYGPHAGVLWAAPDLFDGLPLGRRDDGVTGGATLELGTPSFEALAGIRVAAEYLTEAPPDAVDAGDAGPFAELLSILLATPGVKVYGPHETARRAPTVSFNVGDARPEAVAARLAEHRVAVWSGDYLATELFRSLGLSDRGAVRVGLVRYNDAADVARFADAFRDVVRDLT